MFIRKKAKYRNEDKTQQQAGDKEEGEDEDAEDGKNKKRKKNNNSNKTNGLGNKRPEKPFCVMDLNHGDMVVMHGPKLQERYEHRVKSMGRLRYALTARHVKSHLVDERDHWKGNLTLDLAYEYDGDEN